MPVGPVLRFFYVVERLRLGIDRLFADVEDLAEASAERHGPLIPTRRIPVGGDNGCAGEIPSFVFGEVVVNEVLGQRAAGVLGQGRHRQGEDRKRRAAQDSG